MWEKLREVNESTGTTRLMKLMREVHYGQLQENDDINERINTYFANIEKLVMFGFTFNDRSISLMLLESLGTLVTKDTREFAWWQTITAILKLHLINMFYFPTHPLKTYLLIICLLENTSTIR